MRTRRVRSSFAFIVRAVLSRRMGPTLLSMVFMVCLPLGMTSAAHGQVYPVGVPSGLTASLGNWGGPVGVATDSNGNLYVVEHAPGGNNQAGEIVEVNAVTHVSSVIIGSTTLINGEALSGPQQICIDASNNLYIADSDNGRIVVYSTTTPGVLAVYATSPNPFGVALDASGNIWVDGNATGTAGYGYVEEIPYGSSTAIMVDGVGLDEPRGILFDSAGNLYVSDYGNGAVYKYAPPYTTQTTLISGITTPAGMIFDAQGNLDIASGITVTRYLAPDYSTAIPLVTAGLTASEGIAADAKGDLFVTNYVNGAGTLQEISPVASLGSQALNTTSSTVTYNFAVASGTVISSFNVLDQGVTTHSEFARVTNAATDCVTGILSSATVLCSIEATFTPQYPGNGWERSRPCPARAMRRCT